MTQYEDDEALNGIERITPWLAENLKWLKAWLCKILRKCNMKSHLCKLLQKCCELVPQSGEEYKKLEHMNY